MHTIALSAKQKNTSVPVWEDVQYFSPALERHSDITAVLSSVMKLAKGHILQFQEVIQSAENGCKALLRLVFTLELNSRHIC